MPHQQNDKPIPNKDVLIKMPRRPLPIGKPITILPTTRNPKPKETGKKK